MVWPVDPGASTSTRPAQSCRRQWCRRAGLLGCYRSDDCLVHHPSVGVASLGVVLRSKMRFVLVADVREGVVVDLCCHEIDAG
jgi:hypothetical protein